MRRVLGDVQRAERGKIEVKFRRRLAVRRHLEDDFDAIDDAPFARLADEIVRPEKRHGAARDRLSECRIHLAANAFGRRRPNWYCARRAMALPAMTFSDTA